MKRAKSALVKRRNGVSRLMIERINWPEPHLLRNGQLPSPFLRGRQERSLRITFHISALATLPQTEAEALAALRELAHLPEIEALQTELGDFPCIEIGDLGDDADHVPINVTYENGSTMSTAISPPRQFRRIAVKLVHEARLDHPKTEAILSDLLTAQAHCALGQDILVTLSDTLLGHRDKSIVGKANPRKPTETAQIVGLFLRSRANYTYRASESSKMGFDRGLFYWVLVRHRLPGMWRYFSACVRAAEARSDDTSGLGQSILVRCARAMQARDAIGEQFYCPQDNNTRDSMMYHFDYLTMLLAGSLDAQARIAHRAYGMKGSERSASFRNSQFVRCLKSHGGKDLCCLASGQNFRDIMTLLYTLRNTIHGSRLPSLAYGVSARRQESFAAVPAGFEKSVWEAAVRCGSPEKWGLIREHGLLLEPYTFSLVLVEECFKIIDDVAKATDVSALFPKASRIPTLLEKPPDNNIFREQVRRRLAVLG